MFRWLPTSLQRLYRSLANAVPYARSTRVRPPPPPEPEAPLHERERIFRVEIIQDAFCQRRPIAKSLFRTPTGHRGGESWCERRGNHLHHHRCPTCTDVRDLHRRARRGDPDADRRLHRLATRAAMRLLAERRQYADARRRQRAAMPPRDPPADPKLFFSLGWARWRARRAADPGRWFIVERRAVEAKLVRAHTLHLRGQLHRRRTRASDLEAAESAGRKSAQRALRRLGVAEAASDRATVPAPNPTSSLRGPRAEGVAGRSNPEPRERRLSRGPGLLRSARNDGVSEPTTDASARGGDDAHPAATPEAVNPAPPPAATPPATGGEAPAQMRVSRRPPPPDSPIKIGAGRSPIPPPRFPRGCLRCNAQPAPATPRTGALVCTGLDAAARTPDNRLAMNTDLFAPDLLAPDLFAAIRDHVLAALREVVPDAGDDVLAKVEVTPTKDQAHGDMATNAALVVAKAARLPPPKIAASLAGRLRAVPDIAGADPAGPGFVNLRLRPSAFRALLPHILRVGETFGDSRVGAGVAVNVEYVSANPTGPMHVGHCRGAVVGDAIANLLAKAGYAVTKEYYVNDAGAQVASLAWAAYWRYLQAIDSPTTEDAFDALAPGGLQYRGDYLIDVGARLAECHGTSLAAPDRSAARPSLWFEIVLASTVAEMMAMIRDDLALLGIRQDVFTSERALLDAGAVDRTLAYLRERGMIYEGVLDPPKGKTPDDWEPREQTLFRATAFGDDVDRPLRKSDGSNTYFANDIAYHADKIARGADVLIDVLGADHGGYVKRMAAAVQALSADRSVTFEAAICQIVHLLRGGEPMRMSKRAGTFVTLRDLLEEVGRDAVRFTMLTRKADAQMEFDLDVVVAQTRDNPVFYVQYAHARCRSVLRAAAEMFPPEQVTDAALAQVPLDTLEADPELAVMRRLAGWPRLVDGAAQSREPHRIAFFLYALAGDFHMLWNRGKDNATLRFLQADAPVETLARLALVAATATVIRSGLAVMGVEPVEEMR